MDREGLALYKKQNPDNQSAGVLQLHGDSDHQGSVNKILHPDDIRKGPYYSRTTSALSPEETLSARFVRQMQDKFQVLKAVQDSIRKSGGKLDDSNDAYLAEELFHGKAENDLNVMKERYVKPLAKLLAVYDIPQSALDEYLYARHAPERNAHIAKINPKMPDGGSGMTNAEAADIMDKVRRSGKQAQYDRLAGIVDDMLARRRELIRESGLEDDGVIDAWQKIYRHYVPLKGQDEDGVNWYDKVPDYVKEHNLVIMKSLFGGKSGEYWSIPLPYGYNMFYLLGSTMEGVTRGDMTASKAAGNIVGGMLGAFNPLGSEDSQTLTGTLFKNAAPTILRPFADLWANESFMGTPIYQTNFPGSTPKPESSLGRRSTPEAYKAFAGWLNRVSGGSQYRSGVVDINPDIMKYWIDYMSGGMGRFAGKTIDAAAKTYNGIDIPAQQVPFLGKLSGQVMPYADQQKMYDHIDELRQYNAELKALHGADRTAFRNKYRGQLSMNGIIHQSEIQLKNLRKQRDEVYSDPALTARQQADRVLMIEQNMKKVVDGFNREYREKVGD